MGASAVGLSVCYLLLLVFGRIESSREDWNLSRRSKSEGLCDELIRPAGYLCSEHVVQTDDGFLLGLQRVSSRKGDIEVKNSGPPVLLQHGLFMDALEGISPKHSLHQPSKIIFGNDNNGSKGTNVPIARNIRRNAKEQKGGDAWFLNSVEQSLGFILADHGFDVWVGNVRGTHWSHGHISLSEWDKEFWNWSWQELALYDLSKMIEYVHSFTNSKVFFVGHSQGTIMALAAFTRPEIVDMVEAAALLCPISFLDHVNSQLVLRMVHLHLDQVIVALGIHQLNFRNELCIRLVDSFCDGMKCGNLLSSITGDNCCFNNSRVDFYLEYEPHPSSSKNMNHLFQMIRTGKFAKYDYGLLGNLKRYGRSTPPAFDIASIPNWLPLWMGYGGNDALADLTDVEHMLKELKLKPELLYLKSYGHVDFLLSVKAKEDVYNDMIKFFRTRKNVVVFQ